MKQKGIYLVVALLAAVGVFLLGASYGPSILKPNIPQFGEIPEKVLAVSVLIDDGDKLTGFRTMTISSQLDVLQALKQVTSQNNLKLDYDASSPMGAFVKQIGDKINGQDTKYWQYWVNGTQPMVAADKYQLKGGESVLWTFRKSAL